MKKDDAPIGKKSEQKQICVREIRERERERVNCRSNSHIFLVNIFCL